MNLGDSGIQYIDTQLNELLCNKEEEEEDLIIYNSEEEKEV